MKEMVQGRRRTGKLGDAERVKSSPKLWKPQKKTTLFREGASIRSVERIKACGRGVFSVIFKWKQLEKGTGRPKHHEN